jgi:hypothetical protein
MGLLSKIKHSKEECAPAAARNNATSTTTPPSSIDLSSSMSYPKASPQSYTVSETSTLPKDPPPGYVSGSLSSTWPAVPRAGDYEARIAKKEEDSKAHPHKKSWIKKKLDLADPTEREYYERRFTASGEGSEYEQNSKIAMLGVGGLQ